MLPGLLNNPNLTRRDIIDRLKQAAQVTHSTAVSYYERIAKELGHTNKERKGPSSAATSDIGTITSSPSHQSNKTSSNKFSSSSDFGSPSTQSNLQTHTGQAPLSPTRELQGMDSDNPNRIGIIRRVKGAHLVYKRQMADSTFEELWIYKLDSDNKSITTKQAILSGTDIPLNKTSSPDGTQKYQLKTMGDAQMLHIVGLPN